MFLLVYFFVMLLCIVRCLPKKYDLQREPLECLTSKQRQHVFKIQCCSENFCNRNELLKLSFTEGIKQLNFIHENVTSTTFLFFFRTKKQMNKNNYKFF